MHFLRGTAATFKLTDSTVSDNYGEKEKLQSWNKSSFLYLNNFTFKTEVEKEELWKKENTSNTKNSTLSLHISAFENSVEPFASDSVNGENLKKEKSDLNNQLFSGSIIETPFEFPRQQKGDRITDPEAMQFRASQRLINPNQHSSSNNARSVRRPNVIVQPNLVPVQRYRQQCFDQLLIGYGSSIIKGRMAVTDNTALLRARCKMIKTRQNALKLKEKNNPEPIPPSPTDAPSPLKLLENSHNFRFFATQARDILRNISELRNLVLSKRRDYLLCSGGGHFSAYGHSNFISDYDRRQFDSDSDTAMRQCGKLIKSLKSQMESDKSLREDEHKHLQCVIQLLTVYLKEVCKIVAQLREIHLKKTQNLQRICRLANLVDLYESNLSAIKIEEEAKVKRVKALEEEFEREAHAGEVKDEGWEKIDDEEKITLIAKENAEKSKKAVIESEISKVRNDGIRQRNIKTEPMSQFEQEIHFESTNPNSGLVELSKEEQAQLLAENEELFIRFARTNTEIEKIESQMAEIKKLQDTFAEKVLEQEVEIENIHVTTTHTLDNLEAANDFIRQAIQNSASRRVIMLFCLIVLTFTLLFLDWYNP